MGNRAKEIVVGLLGVLAAVVFLADVFYFPGLYVPAVFYVVPILLAAYYLSSPRAVAGIGVWTISLQTVAYLLEGAGLGLLPTSYMLGLGLMAALSVALSHRVEREAGLRAQLEVVIEQTQAQNEELRSVAEQLQSQSEELQSQSEELQAQNEELVTQEAERDRLLAESRHGEAKLTAVVENTQAQLALLDRDLNFVMVNSAYERGSGYTRENLIGRNHFALFPHAENQTIFERVRDTGEPFEVLEKPFEYPDQPELGTTYWNWVLVPIKDGTGQTRELLLSLLDVTDQVRARQRVEEAVRLRDEFLSVAAHELKTPVTSLRGFAQVIVRKHKMGNLQEGQIVHALTHIDQQTKRLTSLTEQLLDASRLEAGKLSLAPEETLVSSVVERAVGPIRELYPDRTFIAREAAPVRASIDPLRMEQVITNLVGNAVKFSPPDTPVEVEVCLEEPETVTISVRDYGHGVPEDDRCKIFERFYQAHAEHHYGGMGLGLFVSAQIVEMHGGTITCEAPEGQGSRFVVRLPLIGGNGKE